MYGKLFFIGTGAFALGILYGTLCIPTWRYLALSVFLGILCVLFCLGIVASRLRTWMLVTGLVLVCMPLGEVRAALAPHALPVVYDSLINTQISLVGTIIADPDIREKNQQLVLAVMRNGMHTNILVFAPLFQYFAYGEKVLIAGDLQKPAPFTTDTGQVFRYDQYLAKKGIFSIVPQADILEVAAPSGLWDSCATILFQTKHTFVAGLSRALPSPYTELATGLLTGDQHSLGDALVTTLALSGLIWVVVLSGYHVTLIAEAIRRGVSFLPRRLGFLISGMSVLAIVFATGGSAPSLRGGLMACMALFARATGRTYDALRALCAAAILILLWNPLLLAYDSGFQLSLVITPALILGTPILERFLLFLSLKNSFLREVIAVSIVAQLACLPLILWQTGQLGVWAIPANMLVMWLVPAAMLFSMIAGVAGVALPLLAPLVGLPAHIVLYYILKVAKISARLPYASVVLPSFPFVFVPVVYAFLALILYGLDCVSRPKALTSSPCVKPLRSKTAFQ